MKKKKKFARALDQKRKGKQGKKIGFVVVCVGAILEKKKWLCL